MLFAYIYIFLIFILGSNLMYIPKQFSGNYWWGTAGYASTLKAFNHSNKKYDAEAWILSGKLTLL